MNENIGSEKQEDKHIILNRAVNHLETILKQADTLLADITYDGSDEKADCDNDAKGRHPNLEEVLITAPERINDYVEEISMRLSKIRNAIF